MTEFLEIYLPIILWTLAVLAPLALAVWLARLFKRMTRWSRPRPSSPVVTSLSVHQIRRLRNGQ